MCTCNHNFCLHLTSLWSFSQDWNVLPIPISRGNTCKTSNQHDGTGWDTARGTTSTCIRYGLHVHALHLDRLTKSTGKPTLHASMCMFYRHSKWPGRCNRPSAASYILDILKSIPALCANQEMWMSKLSYIYQGQKVTKIHIVGSSHTAIRDEMTWTWGVFKQLKHWQDIKQRTLRRECRCLGIITPWLITNRQKLQASGNEACQPFRLPRASDEITTISYEQKHNF